MARRPVIEVTAGYDWLSHTPVLPAGGFVEVLKPNARRVSILLSCRTPGPVNIDIGPASKNLQEITLLGGSQLKLLASEFGPLVQSGLFAQSPGGTNDLTVFEVFETGD